MRTTVDLPPELLRAAKVEAATRGETLKEFLTRAVANQVGSAVPAPRSARVTLPLVGSGRPGMVDITNDDIEGVFADEDAEKYGNDTDGPMA